MAHGHAANCLHLQQSGQRPTSCHTYSLTLIVLTAPNLIPQPPNSETPSICEYTKSFPLNSTYKRLLEKMVAQSPVLFVIALQKNVK